LKIEERKDKVKEIAPIEAHKPLSHLSIQATKDAAKALGWHLKGNFETCESCDIEKATKRI
jgi:hypothetical protein